MRPPGFAFVLSAMSLGTELARAAALDGDYAGGIRARRGGRRVLIVNAFQRWRRPLGLVALVGLSLVILTLVFNAAAVHAFAGNSDGATVVLEGEALRQGHLALGGWSLSLDSFWTVDAIFYAGAILLAGLRADQMHVVPALLGALVVVLAVVLAGRGASWRGRLAGGLAVIVILAVPSHALAFFFLQGPWHVGTALYCLVAFALLSRSPTLARASGAAVVLAAGLLGDLQTLPLGVIPVALAGLTAAARTKRVRAGVVQVAVAAASIVLAVLVRFAMLAIGTFRVAESHRTVSLVQAEHNIGHFLNWGAAFLGVHQGPFGGPVISRLLEVPRLFVLAGFVVAFVFAAASLVLAIAHPDPAADLADAPWRLDDLLLFGGLASFAVFEYLTLSNNLSYARYLDPLVIYGTVLAAHGVARLADRATRSLLVVGGLVLALVAASSAAVLVTDLGAKPPATPTAALEHFLADHDLRLGIGDYWAASVVTVDTREAIRIRPVVANLSGKLVGDGRNATSAWYPGSSFEFLVYDKVPFGRVDLATAERTFGVPSHVYQVGRYSVALWPHTLRLGPETFP